MSPVLFRCPSTGLAVQGWYADEISDSQDDQYVSIVCLACRQQHLVNPKTGQALGET
jgi:hypothetical protein